MASVRSDCAVVSLSGSILVIGGCDVHGAVVSTEALSLETMTFAVGPILRTAREGCAALALPQGHSPRRALVMGGYEGIP